MYHCVVEVEHINCCRFISLMMTCLLRNFKEVPPTCLPPVSNLYKVPDYLRLFPSQVALQPSHMQIVAFIT